MKVNSKTGWPNFQSINPSKIMHWFQSKGNLKTFNRGVRNILSRYILSLLSIFNLCSCQHGLYKTIEGKNKLLSVYQEFHNIFYNSNRAGYIEIKYASGNHFQFFAMVDSISEINYAYSTKDNISIFKSNNTDCFKLDTTFQYPGNQIAKISSFYNCVPWNTSLYVPKLFEIQGPLKSSSVAVSKSKGTKLAWQVDTSAEQIKAVLLEIYYDGTLNKILRTNAPSKNVSKQFILLDTGEFDLNPHRLNDFPPAECIEIQLSKINFINLILNGKNLPIKIETKAQSQFKLVK